MCCEETPRGWHKSQCYIEEGREKAPASEGGRYKGKRGCGLGHLRNSG
jgi:hypothetical protein